MNRAGKPRPELTCGLAGPDRLCCNGGVDKPWLKSYPAGVPAEIDLSRYRSILDLFDNSCATFRVRTAFQNFGTRLSYGELERATRSFAAWLQRQGLKQGV